MNILAVETSGMVAAVSVVRGNNVVGEFMLEYGKTHSQQLMPLIDQLMLNLDIELMDIDVFAVSKGPGSFTGLRIGVSTIRGLAQALNKPVIGVPTLDGLAYNLGIRDGLVCPIMDARRDQVYTSIYRAKLDENLSGFIPKRLHGYMAIPVMELIQKLKAFDEPVIFNGDGVFPYFGFIKGELGERAIHAPSNLMLQRASSIALLARGLAASNKTQSYVELTPFYLRKSQAEQKLASKG